MFPINMHPSYALPKISLAFVCLFLFPCLLRRLFSAMETTSKLSSALQTGTLKVLAAVSNLQNVTSAHSMSKLVWAFVRCSGGTNR